MAAFAYAINNKSAHLKIEDKKLFSCLWAKSTRAEDFRTIVFCTIACTWQKTQPLQVIAFCRILRFLLCSQCVHFGQKPQFPIGQFLPVFIAGSL